MTTVAAPTLLDAISETAAVVREQADESERVARHTEKVVAAMKANGCFKGLLPKELGGFEVDAVGWFEAVEAAARVEGSFGWTMFINGSSGLGGQTRTEEEAEAFAGDADAVGAGAVFPFGKATVTEGGYIANGRWTYASGVPFAKTVFGFAQVYDGETPRMMMPGMPAMAILTVPVEEVEILPTWDVSGLSATGSNDFTMTDVFVPQANGAVIGVPAPKNRYYAGPLYNLPFMTLFGLPIGGVALGIAQHAIDAVMELAARKTPAGSAVPLRERPLFHMQLSEAEALVNSARAWLHQLIGEQFQAASEGRAVDLAQRNQAQLAASNAVRASARAVELMYLAGGGTANYRSSPLQRCMRDMHAVTQHAITSPGTWEACGAISAGLPPQNPFILL